MPILIPAAFFGTLLFLFVGVGRCGLRQSFLYAATAWTLCLLCATEALSVWSLLRFPALLAFWTACTLLAACCLWARGDRGATRRTLQAAWAATRASRIELAAVAAILSAVLLIAVVAPPNNYESMVYRMMRVVMWMQQGGVGHYPTPELIQLYYPPLSEYNILHFQILTGGDRFANTVHWFALAGCGVLASLIARELKQTFPVQVLAAVVAVTLPMGVVQGSSTQANLLVAFWLLAFTVFVLQYFRKPSAARLVCCGLAFGFALLSKATAYAIAPPVAAVLFLHGIVRTRGWRPRAGLAATGAAVLAVALAVNGGTYWRNWDLFGHPIFDPRSETPTQINEQMNLGVLVSGLVRNAVLHWGTPSDDVNDLVLDGVRRVVGEAFLDGFPGTTLPPALLESGIPFALDEFSTGNFLHFWFLSASASGILLFRRRLHFDAWTTCLSLAVVLGTVFFCGVLQWQQWNSRYHTPLFMLGAPLVATFAARLRPAARGGASDGSPRSAIGLAGKIGGRRGIVAGTFLTLSVPWVVSNDIRPLYPATGVARSAPQPSPSIFASSRTRMYYNAFPAGLFSAHHEALDVLPLDAQRIGLHSWRRAPAYLIRVLLEDRLNTTPRLEYVQVPNVSGLLRDGDEPPFVIALSRVPRRSPRHSHTLVAANIDTQENGARPSAVRVYLDRERSWHPVVESAYANRGQNIEDTLTYILHEGDYTFPLHGRIFVLRWLSALPSAAGASSEPGLSGLPHPDVYIDRTADAVVYVRNRCRSPAAQWGDDAPVVSRPFRVSLASWVRESGGNRRGPWQWERGNDADGWVGIPRQRPTWRYTPTAADVGYSLRASVEYTDGDGNQVRATTTPSRPVVRDGAPPAGPRRTDSVFFLEMFPSDAAEPSGDGRRGDSFGFETAPDFEFDAILDEPCFAIRVLRLPFDVARVRTGEYTAEGPVWEADVSLP